MKEKNKQEKQKKTQEEETKEQEVKNDVNTENTEEQNQKNKIEDISEATDDIQKQLKEMQDKYLRLAAEYDNYRKRTMKEKMDLIKSGGEDVIVNILPVLDNFERALKAIDESDDVMAVKDGITLIYNQFIDYLKQRGVQEIEALNKQLDTDLHEAVAQIPAQEDKQKGKIIDIIQKGYKMKDKVIRFAKVVVAQ